ncbi:TonB-dependent receptor plug domain-containing protein [Brevundimonas aveniformis]|uniref:TonB-dependent receptor plug domain-containing protein n=2 Tax=Brevundimonas aveniformis TaxID=370977 RepID=UPI000424EC31|nr:TonB-dependent receptor [Brevundimonas aveniformis]
MRIEFMATGVAAVLATVAGPAWAQDTVGTDPVAPRATAPEGVTIFDATFFAANQPNSAMDMVDRVPGFSFDEGDNVRGLGGTAPNVLVDGRRPASKSEPMEDTLRRIPAGQVLRLELIRGGAPGIDMQGQPVVVNVVRVPGAGGNTTWAVASGWYQDGRTTPAMRFEGARPLSGDRRFEWSSLIYTFLDDGAGEGPRQRYDSTGSLIRDGYSDETAGGRGGTFSAGWQQNLGGGRLALNSRLQVEDYDYALEDAVFAPVPGSLIVEDDYAQTNGEIGVNWQRPLGEQWRLEAVGIQRLRGSDFASVFNTGASDGEFTEDSTSGESIGRLTLRQTRTPTWSLEGGGEMAFNFLESATTYTENGVPIVLPFSDVRVEELRGEVFATSTWRPTSQWSLELGMRAEVSTITQSGDTNLERSFFYPKPRALVTWTLNEENQIRLRLEREVGQLDFGDFVSSAGFTNGVVTAGNSDLEPDKTWVAELAWERSFWDEGSLVVTLAHEEITDASDRVPIFTLTDVFDAPGNIGDGTEDSLGIDLTVPLGRLGIAGGRVRFRGEWSVSEVRDPTTGALRRMSGQEPFEGEINFTQALPQWNLQWGGNAFLGFTERHYRFDTVETIELEPWYNLFAEWRHRPDLSFRVELQNLSGRNFIRTREVYAGPRDVSPVAFTETRDLNFDPFIYFRIRRTWG